MERHQHNSRRTCNALAPFSESTLSTSLSETGKYKRFQRQRGKTEPAGEASSYVKTGDAGAAAPASLDLKIRAILEEQVLQTVHNIYLDPRRMARAVTRVYTFRTCYAFADKKTTAGKLEYRNVSKIRKLHAIYNESR